LILTNDFIIKTLYTSDITSFFLLYEMVIKTTIV